MKVVESPGLSGGIRELSCPAVRVSPRWNGNHSPFISSPWKIHFHSLKADISKNIKVQRSDRCSPGKRCFATEMLHCPGFYYDRETTKDVLYLSLSTNKPVGCVGIHSSALYWCLNLGCTLLHDRLNECLNKATSKKNLMRSGSAWRNLSFASIRMSPQGHQMKGDLQNCVIILLSLLRIKKKNPCGCTSSKPCWH